MVEESLGRDATYSEISTSLDIPKSTVANVIKVFRDKGISVPSKRLGVTPKVTKRTQPGMVRSFRKEPFVSIVVQHQRLVDVGSSMSMVTFRKNMKLFGFGSHVRAHKYDLTERRKENQLKWCQDKVNWTIYQ
ncbi:hypothetical protein CLU79DRAFT_836772 [Phycomyces nitens]|nr:hypothetical protein CLU79DRAFT_836772 [Phycomyces nitens]